GLERGAASDRALEQLRRDIVGYREQFLTAQGANQNRIDTLQAQIAALGTAPGPDETPEAPEITASRAELTVQLARIIAPRRAAEAAYNRADGLIREIDSTVRERQAARVLRLGPSPLNPALWPSAFRDLGDSGLQLRDELA